MSRAATVCVCSRMRSAIVDLPWSMWAMMEKFLMCVAAIVVIVPAMIAHEGRPRTRAALGPTNYARRPSA